MKLVWPSEDKFQYNFNEELTMVIPYNDKNVNKDKGTNKDTDKGSRN